MNRKINLSTFILGVLLIAAVVYSGISQRKLTKKLQSEIESMDHLTRKYDSLQHAYHAVYSKLQQSKKHIEHYKNDLDSIMEANIRTVSSLKKALEDIIEKQKQYEPADTTQADTLRF